MNSVSKNSPCLVKTTRRIAALTSLMIAAATGVWANAAELYGKVVGVTDGDTVTVLDDTKTRHTIRLASIDAPETSCHSKSGDDSACRERGQAFGKASKRSLSEIVYGKSVVVKLLPGSTYGREIGTVFVVEDDRRIDANYLQVARGMAWHYTHFAKKQQSHSEYARYNVGQLVAKRNKVGLWADQDPVAPWEYRSSRAVTAGHFAGMR